MMKRFGVSLAVCFVIWGSVAHAETGVTHVLGAGYDSCGQLIAAVGDAPPGKFKKRNTATGVLLNEYARYQEWLGGFISGFNAVHEEKQQISIDMAGIDLWMRNWCNKNPTKSVFYGASVLINELQGDAAAGQR
jgi:hypothetical protein